MATKRTLTSGNFTVTAPPAVHFAFNPWIVELVRTANSGELLPLFNYASLAGDRREPINDAVSFNIARWVQMQFDGLIDSGLKAVDYTAEISDSPFVRQVAPALTVTQTGEESALDVDLTSWAVWGAIGRGETFMPDETRRWFYNYPFTVGGFSTIAGYHLNFARLITQGNGLNAEEGASIECEAGAHFINPAAVWKRLMAEKEDWPEIADTEDTIEVQNTYVTRIANQETGDLVMRSVRLIPDAAPLDLHDHAYLRWVDNLGELRYHLFTETGQTEAVSATSWNKPEQPEPEIYDSFVNDSQTARQQLTATRTRTLGAACIDADEFERLATIARSPIIDVFDGYDDDGNALWHRVNIVAGSYSRDRQHYADFSFSITDRTQTTQEL